MFIGEFVENSLTFLTGGHDSGHAQPGEVLGNCCGGFIDDVREVVYGKFTTVSKCQDDANSSGVREESENFDGKVRRIGYPGSFRTFSYLHSYADHCTTAVVVARDGLKW